MKLYLLSLGCARNLVDSEIMLGRIKRAGWTIVEEPEAAEVIVVNTCSFIEDAADESIEMILELAQYKQAGSCQRLVVAGCLPERYREEIVNQMPEVDAFLGTGAYDQIVTAVEGSKPSGGWLAAWHLDCQQFWSAGSSAPRHSSVSPWPRSPWHTMQDR